MCKNCTEIDSYQACDTMEFLLNNFFSWLFLGICVKEDTRVFSWHQIK